MTKTETKEVAKREPGEGAISERFTAGILREFVSASGDMATFGTYQRQLAQHLFVKIDSQLKALEAKRLQRGPKDNPPIIWANLNMQKLALDSVHRIELGLDALIPNHIHPIPYLNGATGKYDMDLRIGYVGKAFYRRMVAENPPADVRIELVYSTDKFRAIKKSLANKIEDYEFEIIQPFDRGDIVGGFGYLVYDDPERNTLVLVSEGDFQKSRKRAKGDTFWTDNPVEMRYKTLVHRVTEKMAIDPRKMRGAVAAVEAEADEEFQETVDAEANSETVDLSIGEVINSETKSSETEKTTTRAGSGPMPGF